MSFSGPVQILIFVDYCFLALSFCPKLLQMFRATKFILIYIVRNKIYLMHIPGLSKTSFHFQMLMRLWIQTMVSLWLMLTRWSSFSTMHLRQPNGWRITQSCPLKKSIVLIEAPGWWVIMIVQLDSLNIESSELSQVPLVFSTHIVPLLNASWRKYTKQYSAIWLFHFAGSVSCPFLVLWKFKVSGTNWWN